MTADDLQSEPSANSTLLDAALRYAARGFHVFPTRITKAPFCAHGVKDATIDPEQIARWWAQWPNAGIGLACGAISGVWALDVDTDKGGQLSLEDLEMTHGVMPDTLESATGGGGRHLFFRAPVGVRIRNSVSSIGAGLDCRGDGGYVVLPPSRHESGNMYRWAVDEDTPIEDAPAWLLKAVTVAAAPAVGKDSDQALPSGIRNPKAYVAAALSKATSEIANAPPGTANNTLNSVAFGFQKFINAGWVSRQKVEDELFQAAEERGKPASEIRKTLASALGSAREPNATSSDHDAQPSWGGNSPQPVPLSQDALAVEFASMNEALLRHCDGLAGWLWFDGTRWLSDDRRRRDDSARTLVRLRASGEAEEKSRRTLCSSSNIEAIVRLARSDPRIAATIDQFDADPYLLNTMDGVVDLRTGQRRRVQSSDYFRKVTAVGPGGSCPRWERFQLEIMGNDPEMASFLKRLAGYALTGLTSEQKLFFFFGSGANGKSTWLDTLASVLGDYAYSSPIDTFTEARSDRHPTELAALAGARLVYASETEQGRRWAESRIKSLTGGDTVTARWMRGDFFSYKPQLKLVIAGNHRPALQSVDIAMRRRLILIPFDQDFRDRLDPQLPETLRAERAGILQWAIDGCLDWQRAGLQIPGAIARASEDYFEAQDAFGHFLDACLVRDPQGFVPSADLFKAWKSWAEANGEPVEHQRALAEKLQAAGFPLGRRGSKRVRGREGLRLRQNRDDASGSE